MDHTDTGEEPENRFEDTVRSVLVPLTKTELSSLRLKIGKGETEVDAIKRLIAESVEMDAIQSALSKFIDILEKLIIIQKKLNRLGIDSDEESEKNVRELTESVMSVSSLKKRLERRWRSI